MPEAVVYFSDQGWLYSGPGLSCRWRHSPHHNARPQGCGPELVVIHGISLPAGDFGGPWVDALFMQGLNANSPYGLSDLAGLEVSAHFFISREGLLTQYVSIHDRAWHAGVSVFEGRQNCNDFSIGIELEGTDSTPYTAAQMRTLSLTCQALAKDCPEIAAITGHSMIAPDRKTDPGPAFDWKILADQLSLHGISWRIAATAA